MSARDTLRSAVFAKYAGRCAYCGNPIQIRGFHVDHREPVYYSGRKRGDYSIDELEPACARCNGWKLVSSVDQFRRHVEAQLATVMRSKPGLRLAMDCGAIVVESRPVVFYFERFQQGTHT